MKITGGEIGYNKHGYTTHQHESFIITLFHSPIRTPHVLFAQQREWRWRNAHSPQWNIHTHHKLHLRWMCSEEWRVGMEERLKPVQEVKRHYNNWRDHFHTMQLHTAWRSDLSLSLSLSLSLYLSIYLSVSPTPATFSLASLTIPKGRRWEEYSTFVWFHSLFIFYQATDIELLSVLHVSPFSIHHMWYQQSGVSAERDR